MSLTIRSMLAGDAAAVAALCGELGYPQQADTVAARLQRLAASADHCALVVESGGGVVGWAHGFVTCLLESAPYVEIGGLVVSATARRSGAGRALLEALGAWARTRDVSEIRVRSNVIREAAHAFYRACGFADLKTQRSFLRKLDGETR